MKPTPEEHDHLNRLRRQAEEALRGQPLDLGRLPVEDIQFVLHELQVHQAELTLQNEELRQAQEALEVSRNRYSDLYNFAPAGYCTLDRQGRILEANQTLAGLLGLDHAALLQHPLAEFVARGDQDQYYLHRQRAFEDPNRQVGEIRMVRKTGEQIFVRLESMRAHADEPRIAVMLSDISERKRSEQALQASEERLCLATEAAQLGIWEWDLSSGELAWNEPGKAILGLAPDRAVSIPVFLNAIHPDDRQVLDQPTAQTLVAQKIYEREYRVIWPDGSLHWVLDIGQGYSDETGKPVRMAGIAMDITRQKLQEKKLTENAAELEKLNREIQDFTFIASHDMQEPLRKIRAFSNLLREKAGLQLREGEQDYLARLEDAAERLQTMIDSLLAYSRITTKAQPYANLSLAHIVTEVLADLELRRKNDGGKVDVGELPEIEADPDQMRLLFRSLIENALKFTKPGVPPQVKVYAAKASSDGVKPAPVDVYVEDNGIGFDVAHVDRLFQPFHRLVGRSEYAGPGIGLAMARKIVERHGGRITVNSIPGQGSTFRVTLPVKQ